MNTRIKLGLAGLGMALVGVVGAGQAFAATSPLDIVAFSSGVATATVDYTPQLTPQPYNFSANEGSGGSCTGAGINTTPGLEEGSCAADSAGTFINVVCGTGVVTGATTHIFESDGDTYTTPGGYTIAFAGGLGVLVSTGVASSDGGSGVAVGVVDIAPSSLVAPPGPACTHSFTVTAVLATNA